LEVGLAERQSAEMLLRRYGRHAEDFELGGIGSGKQIIGRVDGQRSKDIASVDAVHSLVAVRRWESHAQ
jgi:hypothetical protein